MLPPPDPLRSFQPHQSTHTGELPLSRNLASVATETYESDAAIFDMLLKAGSVTDCKSIDNHPLLAICKVWGAVWGLAWKHMQGAGRVRQQPPPTGHLRGV